jgi:hypothetical protein
MIHTEEIRMHRPHLSTRPATRRRRSWRPNLEEVEGRQLLSATYVLGSDHKLWLETPNSQNRIYMDANVLAFAPVGNGDVFVEGTDHKLWIEPPFWWITNNRIFMDANVLSFAPAGNWNVYVERYDSKLWLEGLGKSPTFVDANVYAFSAAGNGNVYVEGYDGKLWLEYLNYGNFFVTLNRSQIASNVLGFSAAGNGNVYVEGTDEKLSLEAPGMNPTPLDANVLAFAPAGNGDILVEGTDEKLSLEAPGMNPTPLDTSVLAFASAGNGEFLVLGTNGNLRLEAPGMNPTPLDANVLAMAPDTADPVGLGFPIVGTWVGPNPNATTTLNWSGYAAETSFSQPQQNSVSAVSASWVVPKVTGPSTGAYYGSVWVGIDGYRNSTVEQIGTEEDFINGKAVYYAWWEMYSTNGALVPGEGYEAPISNMTISPGDLISASVQYVPWPIDGFILSIVDKSRANDSFATLQHSAGTQSPLAQRSSAEWIVEAPTVYGGIATVPNFGSVFFSDATASINGVTGAINCPSWQSQAINMASWGVTYDTTSALTNLGSSFAVTYNTSAGAGGATRAGPNAGAGEPFGTTAGASGPLAKKVEGPVLTKPAALADGYAPSGMIHSTRYRPGGRVADNETATPSNLPLSWFDFDAFYDGDAHHEGSTSPKITRKRVSLGFDVEK